MLGDFNDILASNEVRGGSFSLCKASLFANMVDSCNMIDIYGDEEGNFTQRKNIQNGIHVRKKLDRCLSNSDWRLSFPYALVEILPTYNSNYNPILMSYLKAKSKKSLFHFQKAWISLPEYSNLVDSTWKGSAGNIYHKLDKIKSNSKDFNEKVFGNIFCKKRQLEARLKGAHKELDFAYDRQLENFEKEHQIQYNQVLAKLRRNVVVPKVWGELGQVWKQKHNFFHTQTIIIYFRRNKVTGLSIDGIRCVDETSFNKRGFCFL